MPGELDLLPGRQLSEGFINERRDFRFQGGNLRREVDAALLRKLPQVLKLFFEEKDGFFEFKIGFHEQNPRLTWIRAFVTPCRATPRLDSQLKIEDSRGSGYPKKIVGFLETYHYLSRGLSSKDPATRRMTMLFWLAILGFGTCIAFGGFHLYQKSRAKKAAEVDAMSAFIEKQSEEARLKVTQVTLGSFFVDLKPILNGKKKAPPGVAHLAEIEMVVHCDVKASCDWVEDHLTQARNEVVTTLSTLDRDDLLSVEGKARIKARILEQLNHWLPQGKILDVYFSKLVAS